MYCKRQGRGNLVHGDVCLEPLESGYVLAVLVTELKDLDRERGVIKEVERLHNGKREVSYTRVSSSKRWSLELDRF